METCEQVYMKQPPKFVAQGKDYVCLLRKAINGLKQSKFNQMMLDNGFKQCVVDYSVFIKLSATDYVFLTIYVSICR